MGTWWQGTRLVAERSMVESLRSRTFRLVTAVLLLVSVAAVVVPQFLGDRESAYTLATVGEAPAGLVALIDRAAEQGGVRVDYRAEPDEGAVRAVVEAGDADAGLAGETLYTGTDLVATFPVLVSQAVVALEVAERLADAGLTPEDAAAVQSVAPPPQEILGDAPDADRAGVGFLVGVVLYLALMFAGSAIATVVAMEKSSRISEVLLAVLRPSQVMVGTVVAVGLVTLLQLLVLTVPLAVAVRVTDTIGLPPVATADLALAVAWFVLGFLMYAFLFAAAGAVVNKMNEVSTTITPITIVLIIAYMLGIIVTTDDADGLPAVVASIFPLSAPLVMPIRWASGTVPVAQLVLAMTLTAATAVALALFASTVYRRALLITGRRAKLREVVGRGADRGGDRGAAVV